jgi:beta-glucosidase
MLLVTHACRKHTGASRTLTFTLDQEDFAFLDDKLKRIVEAGSFTVFVGGSSSTDNQASFEVTATSHLPGLGVATPRMLR